MKLKTIKDIEKECSTERISEAHIFQELRSEAIKWIKLWESVLSSGIWIRIDKKKNKYHFVFNGSNVKSREDADLVGRIGIFIFFFNISGEDLK